MKIYSPPRHCGRSGFCFSCKIGLMISNRRVDYRGLTVGRALANPWNQEIPSSWPSPRKAGARGQDVQSNCAVVVVDQRGGLSGFAAFNSAGVTSRHDGNNAMRKLRTIRTRCRRGASSNRCIFRESVRHPFGGVHHVMSALPGTASLLR